MRSRKIIAILLLATTILAILPQGIISFAEDGEKEMEESRKTPIMGWASWNAYRTDISEEIIYSQAQKLVELGLKDLGYTFVNIDDGWQAGRGEDGYVRTNSERFPSGMKAMADKIHALGLSAGIYSDAGAVTCGWVSDNQKLNDNVGLYGHDDTDLRRYLIDWEYDFIKVDWCGGLRANLSKQVRYTEIGKVVEQIEKETGKDKIYNVCCWSFPGEWVCSVADSWRTGGDLFRNFNDVMGQIDNIKVLAKYNTPGHVNDLDMMQVGNGMTYEEDKSHFSMWCMMSTPLMLGMDLNSISQETLSIISNSELIALDQDVACIQASLVKTLGDNIEVWVKDLGSKNSGTAAVALLNRSAKDQTLTLNFEDIGFAGVESARDLWAHCDYSCDGKISVTVPSHGTLVFKINGTPTQVSDDEIEIKDDGSKVKSDIKITSKDPLINLSKLGTYDWVYYGTNDRKKNSPEEISVKYNGNNTGTYDSAAATYSWSDGTGTPKGTSKSGFGVYGLGAYAQVSTPCDSTERTLSVAIGSYSADVKISVIIGGKVIKTESYSGSDSRKQDRLLTVKYSSDIPTTAIVRWEVTADRGASESINIEGIALSRSSAENILESPTIEYAKGTIAVKSLAYTLDGGELIVSVKDNDGVLKNVVYNSAEAKQWSAFENKIPVGVGFAGTVDIFLWKNGTPLTKAQSISVNSSSISDYSIGSMTAKKLIKDGATVVDVRTPSEFAEDHIDGAINIDYSEIGEKAATLLPDKNAKIIIYCKSAKRSAQATATLIKLGYTAVFNLGSMSNLTAAPIIGFSHDTCEVVTAGDKVDVNFTASVYDDPTVYVSCGKDSTFKDAVPLEGFKVPEYDGYYLTLKAYLVQDGVSHAECEKQFIYWSEKTIDVFASDLEWKQSDIGWGTIGRDKSVEKNNLTIAGKTFSKGIGTHATSTIVMDIPTGSKKFLAIGGCDNEMKGDGRMILYVYIDGQLVDCSSFICTGEYYIFDIDIPENASQIKLYAYEGAFGGNTNDHSDWAIAGFVKNVK